MDNLNTLVKLLNNIKNNATSIINSSVIMMNKVLVDGGEVYEQFREKSSDLTDDQIDQYIAQAITDYIDDSKKVKKEIDAFSKYLVDQDDLEGQQEMFLYQVWTGDVYDNSKTDALNDLNNDLIAQDENFTLETIVDRAMEFVE